MSLRLLQSPVILCFFIVVERYSRYRKVSPKDSIENKLSGLGTKSTHPYNWNLHWLFSYYCCLLVCGEISRHTHLFCLELIFYNVLRRGVEGGRKERMNKKAGGDINNLLSRLDQWHTPGFDERVILGFHTPGIVGNRGSYDKVKKINLYNNNKKKYRFHYFL